MIELGLKVQFNNIPFIQGLLPEREREREIKKQTLSCQQAKHDRAISLKAETESAPPTIHSIVSTGRRNITMLL